MSKLSKIVCVVVLYTYSTFSFALDDSQTPQPHRQQYPPYATEEKQNTATGEKNSTDTASKIIRTPSQYLQPYASYCTQQFQSKEQEWLRNFACDIKITDFVVATFTVILVLVTTLLVVVGLCQSRQLSNTVKLARADFISTHRPRMVIRRIDFDERSSILGKEPGPPDWAITPVKATVVNNGETVAHVTGIGVSVQLGNPQVELQPIFQMEDISGFPYWDVRPGQTRYWYSGSLKKMNSTKLVEVETGNQILCCFIKISYRDEAGTERETGTCRRWDPQTRRFLRVADSDYEYCD